MPDSIRLFGLSQAMKFAHLPEPGGLYDQHPQLLVEWQIIFELKNEFEEREQRKQQAQSKGSRGRRR